MVRTATLDQGSLDRILAKQELVVAQSQVVACGMTRKALQHRIRPGGPWQELLPRIYLAATGSPTPAQREVAAVLYAGRNPLPYPGRDSVLTGLAALRRHGLRVPAAEEISVLIPAGQASQGRRSHAFVRVRPTVRMPAPVCYQGVVQYALPERALTDAARELHSFRQVRALVADAIQQRYCRLDVLQEELAQGPRRGSAWLRRSLAEAADGIRSGAEGDFGDLLRRSGLPKPMFNARLYAGKVFIAVADAWWPEAGVAAEVDSRAWHLLPEDWEHDLRRHARMSGHGIIVLHFPPSRIRTDPAGVVADIKAALATGKSRPPLAVRALPA
jgi:very-short-patch-repair endonuclease